METVKDVKDNFDMVSGVHYKLLSEWYEYYPEGVDEIECIVKFAREDSKYSNTVYSDRGTIGEKHISILINELKQTYLYVQETMKDFNSWNTFELADYLVDIGYYESQDEAMGFDRCDLLDDCRECEDINQ